MIAKPNSLEIQGAQAFLRVIGADYHNPYMVRAVVAWFRQESGSIRRVIYNNPFNIRPGVASKYASGIRKGRVGFFLKFRTLSRGFMAAGVLLKALSPRYGYGTVIKAARRSNPTLFLAALARSSWDGSHYGTTSWSNSRTAKNHLIGVYRVMPTPRGYGLRAV